MIIERLGEKFVQIHAVLGGSGARVAMEIEYDRRAVGQRPRVRPVALEVAGVVVTAREDLP